MVRQATLNWVAAGSAGGTTVLHFNDTVIPAVIEDLLNDFTLAIAPALATSTTVTPGAEVKQLDTATGALVGFLTPLAGVARTGTGGATAIPNVAQGLIRAVTADIVGNRLVRGRIFVPGMGTATMLGTGEMNSTGTNALTAAGNALAVGDDWVIWHRPVEGAGGSVHPVSSVSVWNEFATQRKRRS